MWQTQLFSVSGDIPNTFETALKVAHSDGYVERVEVDPISWTARGPS